ASVLAERLRLEPLALGANTTAAFAPVRVTLSPLPVSTTTSLLPVTNTASFTPVIVTVSLLPLIVIVALLPLTVIASLLPEKPSLRPVSAVVMAILYTLQMIVSLLLIATAML